MLLVKLVNLILTSTLWVFLITQGSLNKNVEGKFRLEETMQIEFLFDVFRATAKGDGSVTGKSFTKCKWFSIILF